MTLRQRDSLGGTGGSQRQLAAQSETKYIFSSGAFDTVHVNRMLGAQSPFPEIKRAVHTVWDSATKGSRGHELLWTSNHT